MAVSQSDMKSFRRCRKAFSFSRVQGLRKRRPKKQLFKGTILDEMISARSKRQDPWAILKKYEEDYRELLREEQEYYGDVIGDMRRIFTGYLRRYVDEKFTVVHDQLELLTTLPDGTEFVVHIDKVVRDEEKRLWIMDHKSHRNMPDQDKRFSDFQLIVYPWVWNKLNPKRPVTGIIWDYIRTKAPAIPEQLKAGGLSKRKNIDSDYETYLDEILRLNLNPEHYQDMLEMLKAQPNTFFDRVTLPLPPDHVVKQILSDCMITSRHIREARELDEYPRSMTYDCASTCEYYQLCQAELRGLDSDFIRKTEYEIKEQENGDEESND